MSAPATRTMYRRWLHWNWVTIVVVLCALYMPNQQCPIAQSHILNKKNVFQLNWRKWLNENISPETISYSRFYSTRITAESRSFRKWWTTMSQSIHRQQPQCPDYGQTSNSKRHEWMATAHIRIKLCWTRRSRHSIDNIGKSVSTDSIPCRESTHEYNSQSQQILNSQQNLLFQFILLSFHSWRAACRSCGFLIASRC